MENAMKYKVGDVVKIIDGGYTSEPGCGDGDISPIAEVESDGYSIKSETGTLWFFLEEELELIEKNKDVASITLDIPTQAMKEFADHCERAAAALERIKDALK